MAETDDPSAASGVEDLVKQHLTRPKFHRVISWELSRNFTTDHGDKETRAKRKSREKLRSRQELSAGPGEEDEIEGESVSSESSSSDSSSDQSDGTKDGVQTQVIAAARTRMGRKAKKRHNQEQIATVMHELGSIKLCDDSDLTSPVDVQIEFTVPNKPVPSLVDLCLGVDWKKRSVADDEQQITISDIAPGLRRLVRNKQQMCRTNALQLKCLHKTLTQHEHRLEDPYIVKESDDSERMIYFRDTRCLFQAPNSESGFSHLGILPVTELGEYGGIDDLVQTIDLMLPSLARHSTKKRGVSSSQYAVLEASIQEVKKALRRRYPKLVKYVFEEAEPYVWWSRGNYGLAKAAFLRLAAKNQGSRRALHLNEIARLHCHQDEPDEAVTFFKEAAEGLKAFDGLTQDALTVQTLTLCANSFDQGILDKHKAERARNFWNTVTKCYRVPASIVRRVVESLLNLRLQHYIDDAKMLSDIVDWLADLSSEKYPSLRCHLSCLYVILNDEMRANQSLQDSPWGPSVWRPVFEQKLKGFLQTMRVVWRTQPLHPTLKFVDDPTFISDHMDPDEIQCEPVADVCSLPLDLRLTSDGYLTGSMRLFLPALRSILLDPYTGRICFPEVPLRPESISSLKTGSSWAQQVLPIANSAVPYHMVILNKMDGGSVEYTENKFDSYGRFSQNNILKYTSNSGHVHELDLRGLVHRTEYLALRKTFLEHKQKKRGDPAKKKKKKKGARRRWDDEWWVKDDLETKSFYEREFERRREEFLGSDQWKKDILAILRKLYQQGKDLCHATSIVEYRFCKKLKEELDQDPKCKMKYVRYKRTWGGWNASSSVDDHHTHFHPIRLSQNIQVNLWGFRVYGETLALFFRASDLGDVLVIVNCKNEQTFQDPKAYMTTFRFKCSSGSAGEPHHMYSWSPLCFEDVLMIPNTYENYHPNAKVIGLYQYTYHSSEARNVLYIFDENGDILRQNNIPQNRMTGPGGARLPLFCVIGTRMYGITPRATRVHCDHITHSTRSERLEHRIVQLQSFRNHLLLGTSGGIAFMNTEMKLCKLATDNLVTKCRMARLAVSEDGFYLNVDGDNEAERTCTFLNARQALNTDCPLIIARNSHVFVLGGLSSDSVEIVQHVQLPDRATEAHYISKKIGFVVSFRAAPGADVGDDANPLIYREHVLLCDCSTGTVRTILPFLGRGPRDFFSVQLPGNGTDQQPPGRYLYLNDGHGALMCVYLGAEDKDL